jgi:hypothetical protein
VNITNEMLLFISPMVIINLAGTNFNSLLAARFAAIQLIEKERLSHHSEKPEYCI